MFEQGDLLLRKDHGVIGYFNRFIEIEDEVFIEIRGYSGTRTESYRYIEGEWLVIFMGWDRGVGCDLR